MSTSVASSRPPPFPSTTDSGSWPCNDNKLNNLYVPRYVSLTFTLQCIKCSCLRPGFKNGRWMRHAQTSLATTRRDWYLSPVSLSSCQRSTQTSTNCCPNLGYFAIHLLGLSTGTILFPPSPSYFRRYSKMHNPDRSPNQYPVKAKEWNHDDRQDDKTAIELCSFLVVWLVLFSLAHLCGLGVNVSRQLVRSYHTR